MNRVFLAICIIFVGCVSARAGLIKSSANSSLTITIKKDFVPYFEEWYNDFKNDGETSADFLTRFLKGGHRIPYVLDYLTMKELQNSPITARTAAEAQIEISDISNALIIEKEQLLKQ